MPDEWTIYNCPVCGVATKHLREHFELNPRCAKLQADYERGELTGQEED